MTNHDIQVKIDTSTELLSDARTFFESSKYDESERCASEVLTLLELFTERADLGEERDKNSQKYWIIEAMAHAYNRLTTISNSHGDYAQALNQAETAIQFCEQNGNHLRKAALLVNIGAVYKFLSDYAKALEYYLLALAINEEIGSTDGIASTLSNIGDIYAELSDYAKALEYMQKAQAIYEEIGSKFGVAVNLGNIGNVFHNLSDFANSLEYYQKSLAINEEIGSKEGIASDFGNIGETYTKPDFAGYDYAKAEEYILQSVSIFEELGSKQELYCQYNNLSDLYRTQQRWEEADRYFQKFYALEKEVLSEDAKKKGEKLAYERQSAEREKQLAVERASAQATEELLHKTLPKSIAIRVLQGETRIADHFESASVLFADVVGFTKISAKMPPAAVLGFMNFIFEHFDAIAAKYGCERIKTIGDGYMAVCGAPVTYPDHSERLACMALEMMKDIKLPEEIREHLPAGTLFHLRIGLHCGEITAGLIGTGKLAYDIYGDAVNTAARMESHGEPGRIHVSEDFAFHLQNRMDMTGDDLGGIVFEEREEIEIKGKGIMKTYFLEKK